MNRRVGIIGAGPGGLAAGVLLRKRGYHVDIFEAQPTCGGRNSFIKQNGFKFDLGPTFFLMPQVLEEIYHQAHRVMGEYIELKPIEPMYRLDFGNGEHLYPSADPAKMKDEIARFSPEDAGNFYAFHTHQSKKFKAVSPMLKRPLMGLSDVYRIGLDMLDAAKYLKPSSVYNELTQFFKDDRVRLAFTFQSKYLGMSPFRCPSLFSILSHIEHAFGVWHPVGGCSQVSLGMAKLFEDLGGHLHTQQEVTKCDVQGKRIGGLKVKNLLTGASQHHRFDHVIMNADFAYGMTELFDFKERKKYSDAKLAALDYSCSTFMLYLGLDRIFDFDHHSIFFSGDYVHNLKQITDTLELPLDPSFYIHNPSKLDKTLAPEGKSSLYVLVPVPNLDANISWAEQKLKYRDHILAVIKKRTGVDLRGHIEFEKVITPQDWRDEFRVYKGATFSLTHSLGQISYFRPHNKSEDFKNLYIVGGGTHPGSGLPTILQSSVIAADLIDAEVKKEKLRRKWRFRSPSQETEVRV